MAWVPMRYQKEQFGKCIIRRLSALSRTKNVERQENEFRFSKVIFKYFRTKIRTMSTLKSELVPIIIIKEIMDQKKELEKILSKHKVKEPEEIEKGIENGKLPEHPSYEDFLSAIALKSSIEEMKKLARDLIKEF